MTEPTIEQRAHDMGWQPKEQFKGDPERWTDAETFVKRGEEFLPFLKATNRKLESEIGALKASDAENKRLLKESREQIEGLLEINSAASRKEAKQTKVELLTALETARKDGNVEAAVTLQTQIDDHEAAIKKAEEKKPVVTKTNGKAEDASQSPEWQAWISENSWYGQDKRRTRLAVTIGGELRAEGSKLNGKEFYDEVARLVEETLGGNSSRQSASKVEGGRQSGGGGEGGGEGKTYADLPADVKATCERLSKRAKVGEAGSVFKDMAAYRAHYANIYWSKE